MTEILYKEESYKIVGAAMNVHKQLGAGFLEKVYQEAFALELKRQLIPFVREQKLKLNYDGMKLEQFYKADFVCFEQIIVELKAQKFIATNDTNQLMNYLKATNLKLGILINFGTSSLQYKRVLNGFA